QFYCRGATLPEPAEVLLAFELAKDAFAKREIGLRGVGRDDVARRAAEQGKAEMLLQSNDLTRYQSPRNAQLTRSHGEVAGVHDPHKALHRLQSVHGRPIVNKSVTLIFTISASG